MLDGTINSETTAQIRNLYDAAQAYADGRYYGSDMLDDALRAFRYDGSTVDEKPRRLALERLERISNAKHIDLHHYPVGEFVSGFLREWCDAEEGYAAKTEGGFPW